MTSNMVCESHISAAATNKKKAALSGGILDISPGMRHTNMWNEAFVACVTGDHPSAERCLSELKNPDVENEAAAFDRHFALVRGPANMLFLAYKNDTVGVLDKGDFSSLRLGSGFSQVREAVAELKLFGSITVE